MRQGDGNFLLSSSSLWIGKVTVESLATFAVLGALRFLCVWRSRGGGLVVGWAVVQSNSTVSKCL